MLPFCVFCGDTECDQELHPRERPIWFSVMAFSSPESQIFNQSNRGRWRFVSSKNGGPHYTGQDCLLVRPIPVASCLSRSTLAWAFDTLGSSPFDTTGINRAVLMHYQLGGMPTKIESCIASWMRAGETPAALVTRALKRRWLS